MNATIPWRRQRTTYAAVISACPDDTWALPARALGQQYSHFLYAMEQYFFMTPETVASTRTGSRAQGPRFVVRSPARRELSS